MSTSNSRVHWSVWLGFALAVRVVANVVTLRLGFQAVSDDDFARVAIAQNFAHAPRWDASGTSWLPAPFWLTGSAMWLLGSSYSAARSVAWATSLVSVIGFCWCCRALGLRGTWLGLASCCFAAMPHAVWLGLATVPEGYVAVLTVMALCSASPTQAAQTGGGRTWLVALMGALSLFVATLSRYETWPAALVVASYHALAWRTHRRRWRLMVSLVCLTGPLCWLAHGAVVHGDASFFVKRVASYRSAIGATPKDWLAVLGNYPRALFAEEPMLTTLGCASLLVVAGRWVLDRGAGRTAARGLSAAATGPLSWGTAAMLAFLIWGDITNGAPTHHPERTLLPCWLAALLVFVDLARRSSPNPDGAPTAAHAAWIATSIAAFGHGLWAQLPCKQFVDRSSELRLGAALAPRLDPRARLWVETAGYGYVAVSVGTGRPWLVDGFNPGDPRQADAVRLLDDATALAAALRSRDVGWAAVPASRARAFETWASQEPSFDSALIFRIPRSAAAAENSVPTRD